eukprot:TRINITY_DN108030_c0_g1_i1.p1 TRINITY_DN108030_c0_g1~~TRINITY_DN108030_c0_g1_i1.p1  ORF type:complete len:597 (+),score=94.43 TRINITY_DN108030_c0_g1_i1:128-1918(+)
MKFLQAVLLPVLLAGGAKLATHHRAQSFCPDGLENRYPQTLPQTITLVGNAVNVDGTPSNTAGVGMSRGDPVWDMAKFEDAMKNDPQWKIGMPWILKAKFSSDSKEPRTFGFMGKDDGAFLVITVPKAAQDVTLEADDTVHASAGNTKFEYRGPNQWLSGQITMTDICLAPKSCTVFDGCPAPRMRKKTSATFGYSVQRCCDFVKCNDLPQDPCTPTSQYSQMRNFSTKMGYDKHTCCSEIHCPPDICKNDTKWKETFGRLGGSVEECCEPKECSEHKCTNNYTHRLSINDSDGRPRQGSTDAECCEVDPTSFGCTSSVCQPSTIWTLKPDAATIQAKDLMDCCEPLLCGINFTCPNTTIWKPNPSAQAGSTAEECCTPLTCTDYTCSNANLTKLPLDPSSPRLGSTDGECCEQKKCSAWSCSDSTKWIHKSDQVPTTGLDRLGSSNEECCEKRFCLPEVCDPITMFRPIDGLDGVQGSTTEQCCEARYCGKFVCDTDDDADGFGTKWYRKNDTNTYRWQGSTNEECCEPIYCSQYTTSHPTKWERKTDQNLQGSTDAECYNELWCSDFCCEQGRKQRENADKHQGSTDEECCIDK